MLPSPRPLFCETEPHLSEAAAGILLCESAEMHEGGLRQRDGGMVGDQALRPRTLDAV